ncbi:hypothetical protein MMB17_02225 [Methylobacterium organophilum]|uniref:hypothetical protein n=1 Tax=Methylobacterium organophilum TaxID=410 RepID=UPI001F12C674|nr:hypothetical protein [Methylobacterium organophilum]UMY18192.1 hypothetical protein MMB17_02225 [Methylobacterium organophilum]
MSNFRVKSCNFVLHFIIMINYTFAYLFSAYANDIQTIDHWPPQQDCHNGKQLFLFSGFPPWPKGKKVKLMRGALFFKDPKALYKYLNNNDLLSELLDRRDIFKIKSGHEIVTLEHFSCYSGQAHDPDLGDGYVVVEPFF